ncbi:ATP-binding protein [Agromyces aurantiacus]|uniref:histidine kinase n=1 Tax=Agromyces aurantiacus TaxID=165814 RepID=A0ABV9R948_9MICO|nr:sensor histidine kinase [Agromyces aurantiacus]MBM7504471.1 two-component system CitB family sensor kinase [Agromyces aurantiacus]
MSRSRMTLGMQLLLLQVAIVLTTVVGTGVTAMLIQERQLREGYQDRMIAVAQSVAGLPVILDAFDDPDPAETIQPVAEVIRHASDVTYVVVANDEGIRYSHPNPDRIGERVSTDPAIPLSGEIYVGTQTGTLGESWRVKVPIFDAAGDVMGQVSVGILESQLRADFLGGLGGLLAALAVAALVGVVGSAWIGRVIRRRIYGLEPDEIRAMLETREAMLHGIREGIVAVDERGRLVLMNDAAARLLEVEDPDAAIGRAVEDVLDPELARFIASGEDRETSVLSGERVLLVHGDRVRVEGREIGSIAILRDRTELETTLRELEGAQSLAEGLRAQSHEFSNKLHVVSGLLELGHVDAAIAFIQRVGSGGALSALEEHDGIADVETAALVLAKRSRAQELGVTFELDADSHLETAADVRERTDLVTVIGNLLDNAIEACVLGGHVTLSVRDDLRPGSVVVRVDDDGPGVPPDRRAAIFEPDVSGKSPAPGKARRGIGLTLVHRVAARLGGEVRVEESPAGGARFVARLPWRGAAAPLADSRSRPESAVGGARR